MEIVKIIFLIFICTFLLPSVVMILIYFINLFKTAKYVKRASKGNYKVHEKVEILILIPVLREQNVICETIDYFANLDMSNISLSLCFAGTQREEISRNKFNFKYGTKEIFDNYISKNKVNIPVFYFEASDTENGDRATQLNFAVNKYLENGNKVFDIIGVFDADSRPEKEIFLEVASKFLSNKKASYQQPAFFIDAANRMTVKKENPILIANALYQNTWSVISEIPMWVNYSKSKGLYNGNFYCIGHGEFFPLSIYKNYKFPEHEVTDGIQIGYRLAMSGDEVEILDNYCNDDVPHNLKSLINQHKRWFGGCMRARQAENWSLSHNKSAKKTTKIGIYWSQFRWAFTANLYLLNLILSIVFFFLFSDFIPLIAIGILGFTYCYLLPLFSIMITPIKKKISKVAFLLIPLAIFIKGIGPNVFIFNSIFKKNNNYGKVER